MSAFIQSESPSNVRLMQRLPKDDYDQLVAASDVGLIFLDHRFTIPNFPSRMLNYMQARLPVLACTDSNTDIGKVIQDGEFGWWCESDDVDGFGNSLELISEANLTEAGENGFEYLKVHYSVECCYKTIEEKMKCLVS